MELREASRSGWFEVQKCLCLRTLHVIAAQCGDAVMPNISLLEQAHP